MTRKFEEKGVAAIGVDIIGHARCSVEEYEDKHVNCFEVRNKKRKRFSRFVHKCESGEYTL